MDDFQVDVLVVGAGNAAACAALAARETGASVAMLEAAPEAERGGNSTYTAGAMRVVFHGVDDLVQLYDLTEDEKRDVDFGSYSADQFLDDMGRVTNYRCDPELTDILVNRSFETSLAEGVRFERRVFHALFATKDQKEGMAAFIEKRPAKFSNE